MSQSQPTNSKGVLLMAACVAAAAIGLALIIHSEEKGALLPSRGGLAPGNPMPPIHAAGWLNGSGPTPESIKGKVLVVDAWAFWCGPCLAAAPDLVAAYDKFHPRGAVFLGLTSDETDAIPEMQKFLQAGKIPWPCGYGATTTLMDLKTESIPQVWVVGRDGTIRWNFDAGGHLEDAIEEALAAGPVVDTQNGKR
jgi:thiol-disulfide isomerase/thioredoxin